VPKLNAKVEVTEESEKRQIGSKEIVKKFNFGKTQSV
jgi:hypothetical protein